MSDVHWSGGCSTFERANYGEVTAISLRARTPHSTWACRIDIDRQRLLEHPELFGKTLDRMVRDIEARL